MPKLYVILVTIVIGLEKLSSLARSDILDMARYVDETAVLGT